MLYAHNPHYHRELNLPQEFRQMDAQTRKALVEAIESGEIKNATRFAEEFGAAHGLNPETVRSAISRLRRQLGLLTRHPRRAHRNNAVAYGEKQDPGTRDASNPPWRELPLYDPRITAVTVLKLVGSVDSSLARLGAAMLLRYEKDHDFQRAVDEHRGEIEKLYQALEELRSMADQLPPTERNELLS